MNSGLPGFGMGLPGLPNPTFGALRPPGLGLGGLPGMAANPLAGGLPSLPGLRPQGAGLPGLGGSLVPRPAVGATPPGIMSATPKSGPLGGLPGGPLPAGPVPGLAAATPKTQATPTAKSQAAAPAPVKASTVYVGKISPEVSDDFVKKLLEKCGSVVKWNRAADPNTSKLTSFGFCEFDTPYGVWRALRFLNEKQLADRRLLVKCEEKTKLSVKSWLLEKKNSMATALKAKGVECEWTDEQFEEELDKESKDCKDDLSFMLAEKNKDWPEVKPEDEQKQQEDKEKTDKAKEEEEKKKTDEKDDKDKDKDKDKENDKNKDEAKPPDDKNDAKPPPPDDKKGNDKGRGRGDRSRDRRPPDKDKKEEDEKDKRPSERDYLSKRYRVSRRERDREERRKDRERDDDRAYQRRLREFERTENDRIKRVKRDLRDLDETPEVSEREKRKLLEADLNFGRDDEHDWKRQRLDTQHEREKEREMDDSDRKEVFRVEEAARLAREEEERKIREAKEAEERRIREEKEAEERRIREAEEAERRRRQQEEEERQRRLREEERRAREAEQKRHQEDAAAKLLRSVQDELRHGGNDRDRDRDRDDRDRDRRDDRDDRDRRDRDRRDRDRDREDRARAGPPPSNARDGSGRAVFEEERDTRKHAPLNKPDTPLDSQNAKAQGKDTDMRDLISKVPTDKDQAFAYPIDWKIVSDHQIIDKKLKPWVKKKVVEYLGAEEQGMIEFIMRKVSARTEPAKILDELEAFLDEEAAGFTLKMWRMLIFEILRVQHK